MEWADMASSDIVNEAGSFHKVAAELSRSDLERLLAPGENDRDLQVTVHARMFEVRKGGGAACVSLLKLSLAQGDNTPAITEGPCPAQEPTVTKKWRAATDSLIASRAIDAWYSNSSMGLYTKEKGVELWAKAAAELASVEYRDDVKLELDSEHWVKATKGSESICFALPLYFEELTSTRSVLMSDILGPCDELRASTQAATVQSSP